ncbi:TPA: hypothetical protein ACH3X2_013955 [Trebouxia sp. C0005]
MSLHAPPLGLKGIRAPVRAARFLDAIPGVGLFGFQHWLQPLPGTGMGTTLPRALCGSRPGLQDRASGNSGRSELEYGVLLGGAGTIGGAMT